jgi:hypothetical protein
MKMKHIFWALILSLVLLAVPAYSAGAVGVPTITAVYVATTFGHAQAAANNGTVDQTTDPPTPKPTITTVTITGTNLTGVTGASAVTFFQGTTVDPLITIDPTKIAPNFSTPDTKFTVDVLVAAGAAAGFRDVKVTTPFGTSAAFANGFKVYRASISIGAPVGVSPGGIFDVFVNVNNVACLHAYQFDLSYDPNVIQVNGEENLTGVTNGSITDVVFGAEPVPFHQWDFQPNPGIPSGTILVVGAQASAATTLTGSGYLAKISFSVVGTAGAFTSLTLSGVAMYNSNVSPIVPDTTTNAVTTVVGLAITNTSLPDAAQGVAYTNDIFATGGTQPYTSWSATGLPTGLSISRLNDLTGRISGTPSVSGNFTPSITVTDSQTPNQNSVTKQLNLTVYPTLQVTTSSLPEASQNVIYAGTTAGATGGKTPYTWSWSATPNLPAGLTLDPASGAIGGTPTGSGTFNVTLTVTDSFTPHNTASATLSLRVYPVLQITTSSLPSGVLGSSYAAPLAAGGGKTPYSWSATGLPGGLGLSSNSTSELISGTPTVSGNFTVTITATDAFSPHNTSQVNLNLHIGAGVTITTSSLPDATQNVTYSGITLSAAGGTPVYSWSWNATTSPPGLTLNTATGAIGGTPTVSGNFSVTITASDSSTPSASNSVTLGLQVYPALTITTPLLPRSAVEVYPANPPAGWVILPPGWIVNQPYTATLTASGGKGTYTWIATGLPHGLSLDGTGHITGTPDIPGQYDITFTVTDSFGPPNNSMNKVLSLKIYLAGDANGDGQVTIGDVTIVERVLLGLNAPTAGCDGNLNGVISIGDVTKIERIILKLP